MNGSTILTKSFRTVLAVCLLAGAVALSGCQVSMNGMTLPSPWYLHNELTYAPAGPEFPMAREAAHMENLRMEQSQQAER